MYPEFIAIYVLLIIVIGLLAAVLFFLLKLSKGENIGASTTYTQPHQQFNDQYYSQQYQQPQYDTQYQQPAGSVVFCNQCATQYDSSLSYCPQCGARR